MLDENKIKRTPDARAIWLPLRSSMGNMSVAGTYCPSHSYSADDRLAVELQATIAGLTEAAPPAAIIVVIGHINVRWHEEYADPTRSLRRKDE